MYNKTRHVRRYMEKNEETTMEEKVKKRERDIRVMVPGKNYEETNLAS